MRTRAVESGLYRNYVQKAAEFLQAARGALGQEAWSAAAANAVHAGISGADALSVFLKGVRHAGERHEEAIALLRTLGLADSEPRIRQLQRLFGIKNEAEYEERLVKRSDAEAAVADAERFVAWVRERLPRG